MSNFRHLISSALSFSNRRIRFRHTGAGRRNTAPKPSENESLVTILQNTYDLTTCLPSTCSSSSLPKNTKAAARVRTTAFSCHADSILIWKSLQTTPMLPQRGNIGRPRQAGAYIPPLACRHRPSVPDTLYERGTCTTPAALNAGSEFRLLAAVGATA